MEREREAERAATIFYDRLLLLSALLIKAVSISPLLITNYILICGAISELLPVLFVKFFL